MSELKKNFMTYEGVRKLEEELEELKTVKRQEITEKIEVARGFGDLSENAEYTEARNEQSFVEGRILQLENILKNVEVVDEADLPKGQVAVGSKVKVHDFEFKEDVEYQIVGSGEADPVNNKISNESPVGKVLMGRKKGETVTASTPDGVLKFKILAIN